MCMQISKINDQNGAGKQIMSKFPMKEVKPNWFMVTSGCGSTAKWKVVIDKNLKPSSATNPAGTPGGVTPKINGHNFTWPSGVSGDISKVSSFKFSVKGTNDSYLCFAEEKADDAKKITYVLGGWSNSVSTVKWMPKG